MKLLGRRWRDTQRQGDRSGKYFSNFTTWGLEMKTGQMRENRTWRVILKVTVVVWNEERGKRQLWSWLLACWTTHTPFSFHRPPPAPTLLFCLLWPRFGFRSCHWNCFTHGGPTDFLSLFNLFKTELYTLSHQFASPAALILVNGSPLPHHPDSKDSFLATTFLL